MITGDQIAIAKETCRVLGMGTAVHDYNPNPNPNPSPNPTPNPTPNQVPPSTAWQTCLRAPSRTRSVRT